MPPTTTPLAIIEETLHELCLAIGARPTGSAANQQAQQAIARRFTALGLALELHSFACIDWQEQGASLRVAGQVIPSAVSPYSLRCDLSAEYVLLETVEQLEAADLSGQIAVLHGALTQEWIMPKNFPFWNPPEHQRIVRALEASRPAAVVTVSFSQELPIPIFEDGDLDLPIAVVAQKDAAPLLAGAPGPLRLRIQAQRRPAQAANVIARLPAQSGGGKIVLTAHLDTKPATPGALDNAGGVTALLALAQLARFEIWPFDLEFVLFNGEDYYSAAGEAAYLARMRPAFPSILLAVNVDGVGLKDSPIGVSYYGLPPDRIASCENVRRRHAHLEQIEPWYQGDHMIFAAENLPALALTSSQVFGLVDTLIHTEADNLELLDPCLVLASAEYLLDILKTWREEHLHG
jgi:aminopeptidase YwaD